MLAVLPDGSTEPDVVLRPLADPAAFLGEAILLGDADLRERPRLGVGVGALGAASPSCGKRNAGGDEIDFGVPGAP